MLRTLTHEHALNTADMRATLAAGTSREQIEHERAVSFAFNTTDQLG